MLKRKRTFREYWWLYVVIAFAVILGWTSLFNALDRIRDNEQIVVSAYNSDCDTEALRDQISKALPAMTDQKIIALYVDEIELPSGDDRFKTKLTMQILQSDIVILPESLLREINIAEFFLPLPQELVREGCYIFDGQTYGVAVGGETRFGSFCTQTENYYAFVSPQTVNLAGLNGRGTETDDAALVIFRYLTEVITH